MRVALVFGLMIAAAFAAPPPLSPDGSIYVVKYVNENDPNGSYNYAYELSDGSTRAETGEVRNEGQEDQYIFVKGYFTYTGTDNVVYRTNYESGTDGYQPQINQGPGGAIPPDVAASIIG